MPIQSIMNAVIYSHTDNFKKQYDQFMDENFQKNNSESDSIWGAITFWALASSLILVPTVGVMYLKVTRWIFSVLLGFYFFYITGECFWF